MLSPLPGARMGEMVVSLNPFQPMPYTRPERMDAYVAEQGITWKIALDPDARAALDFGTTGQPETYAISTDGIVVAQQFGEVTNANLETMLRCAKGQC